MSALCPFHYAEHPRPSIFMEGKTFRGYANGRTTSEVSSTAADAYTARTGRSLGTVTGISEKSDRDAEVRAFMRKKGKA